MSSITTLTKVRHSTISAVITRANGKVENLGVISYRNSNPLKTLAWYVVHPKQARHKIQKFLRSYIA